MKTAHMIEIIAVTACLMEGCTNSEVLTMGDHPGGAYNYTNAGYTGYGNYSGYNYQMPYTYKPQEQMASGNWYNPDFRR